MSLGRAKVLLAFAFLGFVIGVATHLVLASVPILEIVLSPWFVSGIAGSVISLTIVLAFARLSSEK